MHRRSRLSFIIGSQDDISKTWEIKVLISVCESMHFFVDKRLSRPQHTQLHVNDRLCSRIDQFKYLSYKEKIGLMSDHCATNPQVLFDLLVQWSVHLYTSNSKEPPETINNYITWFPIAMTAQGLCTANGYCHHYTYRHCSKKTIKFPTDTRTLGVDRLLVSVINFLIH